MDVQVTSIHIGAYTFDDSSNPYEVADATPSIMLSDVAQILSRHISQVGSGKKLLVRGVQSGKHSDARDVLISRIIKEGSEYENREEPGTIFAAPYADGVVEFILEGFHKFKPKSEERPQYPVDLWLIYDTAAYKNVEYMHPRHNVIARDKWKRTNLDRSGLIAIIEVN